MNEQQNPKPEQDYTPNIAGESTTSEAQTNIPGPDNLQEVTNLSAEQQYVSTSIESIRDNIESIYDAMEQPAPVAKWQALAEKYPEAIPALASRVARHDNPDLEEVPFGLYELKAHNRALRIIPKLLGERLGGRLDRYIERRTLKAFDRTAEGVIGFIELVDTVQNPRKQFSGEIGKLYHGMASSDTTAYDYLIMAARHIDNFSGITKIKYADWYGPEIKPETYPLLTGAVILSKSSLYNKVIWNWDTAIKTALPEINEGIHTFLSKQQGSILPRNKPRYAQSMSRAAAETIAPQRLTDATQKVPRVLSALSNALPSDGPQFADHLRDLAQSLANPKLHGAKGKDIVDLIFPPR